MNIAIIGTDRKTTGENTPSEARMLGRRIAEAGHTLILYPGKGIAEEAALGSLQAGKKPIVYTYQDVNHANCPAGTINAGNYFDWLRCMVKIPDHHVFFPGHRSWWDQKMISLLVNLLDYKKMLIGDSLDDWKRYGLIFCISQDPDQVLKSLSQLGFLNEIVNVYISIESAIDAIIKLGKQKT